MLMQIWFEETSRLLAIASSLMHACRLLDMSHAAWACAKLHHDVVLPEACPGRTDHVSRLSENQPYQDLIRLARGMT